MAGAGLSEAAATRPSSGGWRLGVAALATLAFAIRLWKLDGQSLWADEGATAVMAGRSFDAIWRNAALDIHPPLFYWLERLWSLGAGNSEYALRWLPVASGVALVVVLAVLARRLFGPAVAVIAAGLMAVSPFLVLYSQEARMYQQLALLGTLLVYLVLRALAYPAARPESPRWLAVAVVLVALALLLTQYYGVAALAVSGGVAGVLLLTGRTSHRRALVVAGALGVATVLYLPWLVGAWPIISQWPAISAPVGAAELTVNLFWTFTYGIAWEQNTGRLGLLVPLVLIIAGLASPLVLRREEARAGDRWLRLGILALALAAGPLLMYLVSLTRPSYNPKLLLASLPFWVLLLALGLATLMALATRLTLLARAGIPALPRWLPTVAGTATGLVALGMLFFPTQRALSAYFDDPRYARDDYRGVVRYLEAVSTPDDAVILNAPGQAEIVRYYAGDRLLLYPLPRQRPADPADTERALQIIGQDHSRAWTVAWASQQSDPTGIVDSWLRRNGYRAPALHFGDVEVHETVLRPGPPDRRIVDAAFANGAILLSAAIYGGREVADGAVLPLELSWTRNRPIVGDSSVFVQLLGPDGTLWGQDDTNPIPPPSQWPATPPVTDRHGIPVLPGTPAGEYRLIAGLYDPISGARVALIAGADSLDLGPIQVYAATPPPPDAVVPAERRLQTEADGWRAIGYELGRTGEPLGRRFFGPVDDLFLAVIWRRLDAAAPERDTRIELIDRAGQVVLARPLTGLTPQTSTGGLVRTQFREPLRLPAGTYRLELTRGAMRQSLGTIEVGP